MIIPQRLLLCNTPSMVSGSASQLRLLQRLTLRRLLFTSQEPVTLLDAADQDTADEFFVYGAQIEKGTFPTSYIPTYGSTATRTGDLGTLSNVNEFVKGNAYTILFDFDATENKLENTIIFSIKDPNGENSFSCRWHSAAETVRVYNDTDKHYPTEKRASSTNKWLLRINENKFDWFYNNAGTPTKDAASVFTPREMGTFHINGRTSHVNQVLIFDHALPDEDCNSLIS